ncbi:MAG: ABC transporter substrate-binding protein [Bacillota bacterium]|nr:ABC transporter substrate-binding protein [Bacillota bacterium]
MKKMLVLLISLAVVVSLVSCSPQQANESGDKKPDKVTILLDWVPNTNHTGLYAAKELGYYAEEGLDVEILQVNEGGTAQLVAAEKAEFGISYQEEVTYARVEEIPVVAIAAIIQHNTSGFASPASKGIKTPADFGGRRYGGWGSPMEEAVLKAMMDKYGADFNKLEMISIGAVDFFTSVEKDVDFTWIYYGWDGVAAELKGMDLNFISLKDEDKALDFYTPVIIASEDTLKNKPDLVKRFLKATTRGYEYAIENPEKAAEYLLAVSPELDRELVIASQEYLSRQYRADAARWGEMKEEVWEDYAKWMYDRNLIDRMIEPEKAFSNEFLPKE